MRIWEFISSLLSTLFWGLIIFGFEEPYMAILSLICALIHEGGHLIFTPQSSGLRGVISGFRIRPQAYRSYGQKILSYLGGPLANIIAAISTLPALIFGNSYLIMFGLINLATAVSNLLPIEGYDGYGILITLAEMREAGYRTFALLKWLSFLIIITMTVFSLCLIDRAGGGYWIFAIFFSYLIKAIDGDLLEHF